MLLKWCHLIFLWSDKICRTIHPALNSICLPHRVINIHAKCDSHEVNLFICCRFEFRLLHVMSRFDVGHLLYRQLMLKYNNRMTRGKKELRSCIHANAIVDKMSPITPIWQLSRKMIHRWMFCEKKTVSLSIFDNYLHKHTDRMFRLRI